MVNIYFIKGYVAPAAFSGSAILAILIVPSFELSEMGCAITDELKEQIVTVNPNINEFVYGRDFYYNFGCHNGWQR